MVDSILDSHGSEFASAIDPKETAYWKTKDISMEDMQDFVGEWHEAFLRGQEFDEYCMKLTPLLII